MLTANDSGCTIFIDVLANGSLVFYHANSIVQPLPNPNDPTSLAPATQAEMVNMLTAARTDHGITALQIQSSYALDKTEYYQALLHEIQRKQGQGRAVQWEFYCQVIVDLQYSRPFTAPKAWLKGTQVNRTAVMKWRMLQAPRMFFHS